MFLRTVISLGVIALVAVVMSLSAPAEDAGTRSAVPFVPQMEEPDSMPRMQRPPSPEPQREDAGKDMPLEDARAPLDEIEAPETMPLMQRPEPPRPDKGGDSVAEDRVLSMSVTQAAALASGEEAVLSLQFADHEGKTVKPATLADMHGKKAHFFIIDESLKDFHHVHAAAIDPAGKFSVSFTPNTAHDYVVYADVWPVGGEEQIVSARLQGVGPCEGDCTDRSAGETAEAGGIKAVSAFDAPPLKPGEPQSAKIILTKDGKPLENLEPVFGAFAHVAAFYEGFGGMVHVHPDGIEPPDDKARASSPVAFTLHPEAPGYLKYFVQVRVDGKDIVLPFGIMVEP